MPASRAFLALAGAEFVTSGMRWLAVALALTACDVHPNPVTAPGTVLFEWDHTKATQPGFAKARVGAKTSKDFVVTVAYEDTPRFQIDLHVDFAPVDFEEHGEAVHHTAPIAIRATVKNNDAWDLSGKCFQGPSYQMRELDDAGVVRAPEAMMRRCQLSYHRKIGGLLSSRAWELAFTLRMHGDGTVTAFPDDRVMIE